LVPGSKQTGQTQQLSTLNRVVNNGCDVVQVAHPWRREDEVMNILQWRLSFSRADTILLNTWSPTQQLVYRMLRVFVSTIQSYHGMSVIKRYEPPQACFPNPHPLVRRENTSPTLARRTIQSGDVDPRRLRRVEVSSSVKVGFIF